MFLGYFAWCRPARQKRGGVAIDTYNVLFTVQKYNFYPLYNNIGCAWLFSVCRSDVWSRVIALPPTVELQYRYFTGFVRESDHEGEERSVTVNTWETNILPRTFHILGQSTPPPPPPPRIITSSDHLTPQRASVVPYHFSGSIVLLSVLICRFPKMSAWPIIYSDCSRKLTDWWLFSTRLSRYHGLPYQCFEELIAQSIRMLCRITACKRFMGGASWQRDG